MCLLRFPIFCYMFFNIVPCPHVVRYINVYKRFQFL